MHLLPPFSPEYNYFFLFTVVSRSVVSRKRQSSSVEHRVIPPRTLFPTQFYNNPFLHFFFFLFLLSSTTTIIVHTYVPGLISPFPSFFFFFSSPSPIRENVERKLNGWIFQANVFGGISRKHERFWSGRFVCRNIFPSRLSGPAFHAAEPDNATIAFCSVSRLPLHISNLLWASSLFYLLIGWTGKRTFSARLLIKKCLRG